MQTINRGEITQGNYVKYCKFSNAVLWKTKEISLPPEEIERAKHYQVEHIIFIDIEKNEMRGAKLQKILDIGEYRTEGQERQLYIPIDELTKKPFRK